MTNTGGFLRSTYKSTVQVRRGRVSKGKQVADCGQEEEKNHSEVMAQHRILLWDVKSILKQQNQKTQNLLSISIPKQARQRSLENEAVLQSS